MKIKAEEKKKGNGEEREGERGGKEQESPNNAVCGWIVNCDDIQVPREGPTVRTLASAGLDLISVMLLGEFALLGPKAATGICWQYSSSMKNSNLHRSRKLLLAFSPPPCADSTLELEGSFLKKTRI
jgi:hypothetical protein